MLRCVRPAVMLAAVMLAIAICPTHMAAAQAPAHNEATFAKTYARVVEIFGGQEALQAAYEEARAEQARVEGALQISINMEMRLRENGRADMATIYTNAANGLRPTVEKLRAVFARLDALDSPIDESRGKAAYDRVKAEYASLFERPVVEQFEFSKTHPLKNDPLVAVQTAAEALIAVGDKKPA